MAETWQLQDAKSRFCELVDRVKNGPQFVTRRGKLVAVVISEAEYDRLSMKKVGIVDFFRASPLCGAEDFDSDSLRVSDTMEDRGS
jgi:prevent-host-death family protein